ncbi:fungal-specific transcription factor domain-containing protein [Tricladium varicosporioides]|nr:fungal-specific transcription factor domain-containing protein [Hymenoscyphus varicosporioides]
MPKAGQTLKDRARVVCIRCHDRKVRCDLQDQTAGRCRNCQRDNEECRKRLGTRKRLRNLTDIPTSTGPSLVTGRAPHSHRSQPIPETINFLSPAVTTTSSQNPPGFIGELSLLSCPSDPDPFPSSRVESLPNDVIEEIIEITKATLTPSKSMSQALIDIYFRELYWIVPVVSREEVIRQEPPLLLLQSVYFAGGLMRRTRNRPPISSPEDCYKKIKTLLFLDYEPDKMVVLKTLCLLSCWSPNIPQEITLDCPWHWTGMGIRLALQFGFHRESTYIHRISENSGTRKLWWYLFCNDTLQAACYGRPAMIRQQDFDVCLPTLEDNNIATTAAQFSIQLPRLLLNLSNIQSLNIKTPHATADRLESISSSLQLWIDELPDDLKLFAQNATRRPYDRPTSELFIFYFICIILLYLIPGPHRQSLRLCSASVVASSCITRLYEEILYHEDVNFLLPIHGWMILVAAVPQIYSVTKFPNQKETCEEELGILISVLSELHNKYPSAGPVLKKIATFRQKGITFSGLDNTTTNECIGSTAQNLAHSDEFFNNIDALFPFPDCFSPKLKLLRPDTSEASDIPGQLGFMPFNVDEMSWTFDWLASTISCPDSHNWDAEGKLYYDHLV